MNISRISQANRIRIAGALVASQFTFLGVLGLLGIGSVKNKPHTYVILELLLLLSGAVLILLAARNLKPSLKINPIPKSNAPLISIGLYKYLRHPMYLALILIGLGVVGYVDSFVAWTVEILLILTLNLKASFEDALILEIHPAAAHYQRHTSKLIPCLGSTCRDNCATP